MSSARHWLFLLSVTTLCCAVWQPAEAQEDCVETAEGRVCSVRQQIAFGAIAGVDLQRQLGLVTVNGGCSGTLLNRWWVLTARHCVQMNPQANVFSPLLQPTAVTVTASWAPGRNGAPSRFVELGGAARRDIILIHLGRADLGEVDTQRLYILQRGPTTPRRWVGLRLQTTDTVTQYGQGLSTFASGGTGGMPVVLGTGGGVYRSGQFTPSNITGTSYDLAMNGAGQVGHGGDSGGPTIVTRNGVGVGIAGVQSSCTASGYAPGAPANPSWAWATGITRCQYVSTRCQYVSVEPIVREIGIAINEAPPLCTSHAGCPALAPIIEYVTKP